MGKDAILIHFCNCHFLDRLLLTLFQITFSPISAVLINRINENQLL